MTDSDDNLAHQSANSNQAQVPGFLQPTRRRALALGGTVLGAAAVGSGPAVADEHQSDDDNQSDDNQYRVTVTNLTGGQPFTPPAIALHEPSVEVFSVGEQASEPLQQLAENGNLDPLVSLTEQRDEIRAASVGETPLVPKEDPGDTGNSYYEIFEITADESATHLTFLSMLIATNDGFVGLDTVKLPEEVNETRTLQAHGYDAGTEQNTESFDDLVPPAQVLIQGDADGGTEESDPDIAEDDVIRPHPGIQADGDLSADVYGWDEPAGAVHVEKLREDE